MGILLGLTGQSFTPDKRKSDKYRSFNIELIEETFLDERMTVASITIVLLLGMLNGCSLLIVRADSDQTYQPELSQESVVLNGAGATFP